MTRLFSLLAGAALVATIGVAQAAERMALSESQMDLVNAGSGALINGVQINIEGGAVTINGIPLALPPGVNMEIIGNELMISFPSGTMARLTDFTSLTVGQ